MTENETRPRTTETTMTTATAILCLAILLPVCFRAGQGIGAVIVALFGLDR